MPDVYIKTPNLDEIFEKWKKRAVSRDKKYMEKQFGTKGAVFSLDQISAAEYVKDTLKEAAVYFSIKKTVAPSTSKDLIVIPPSKLGKETYYSFKGGNVIKDNWKGDEEVPILESVKPVPCKNCSGKGFIENKCKNCKGSGKIQVKATVLVGENKDKNAHVFEYPCGDCYGSGTLRERCGDCEGHKNQYQYQILPVPFATKVTGIPVLHSSAKTKYEREMERDLHKVIQEVNGIIFNDFKSLDKKAEASLGYWNKKIKKTISAAASDYKKYEKDDESEVSGQIYLFPMIQLMCETKKGRKFEVYSIGSAKGFMVFSNFT